MSKVSRFILLPSFILLLSALFFGGPAAPALAATQEVFDLTGQVINDLDAQPVPKVTVNVYDVSERIVATRETDSNGRFSVPGLAIGRVGVHLVKEGWRFGEEWWFAYGAPFSTVSLEMRTPVTYRVSGQVITHTGQGIPDVTIYLLDGIAPVPSNPATATSKFGPAKTDDFGNWSKDDLFGPVTVMPQKTSWTFVSPYKAVQGPSNTVNFTGTESWETGGGGTGGAGAAQPVTPPDGLPVTAPGTGTSGAVSGKATRPNIPVVMDGQNLAFDQPPIILNGRTMVPMRRIFEALGATVTWDQATKTSTGVKGTTDIRLTVGSDKAYINGVECTLDQPPVLINGRTLVPVRFISEALKARVEWDGVRRAVYLVSPQRRPQSAETETALIQGMKEAAPAAKLARYNQVISLDPTSALAYLLRADVYFSLDQDQQAIADLNKAVELDPGYTAAYTARAINRIHLGQYGQALIDTTRAIELDPTFALAYIARVIIYVNTGGHDAEAMADCNQAITLDPNIPSAYLYRGLLYARLNQKDQAVADFQKVLEFEPDNARARTYLQQLGVSGY